MNRIPGLLANVTAIALLVGVAAVSGAALAAEEPSPAPSPSPSREIEIVVENGYHPNTVELRAGEPARLKFIRKEYSGCTKEVVFPTLGIRRELPPNQPVVIEVPALEAGEVPFHCGMKMVRGRLKVEVAK